MRLVDLPQTHPTRETVRSQVTAPRYLLFKRAFDVVICLLALPFVLLAGVIIAVAIVLDSRGSPIFIQERIGRDGRPFRLYKFRTMHCNHDAQRDRSFMQDYIAGCLDESIEDLDATYKPIKKQDITRVGRFLRKASLDELPQVINVLKGEMSLIGPRPNVPWEVEAYREWHLERLSVLPGITGLAQVNGRSNISFDEIAAYDIEYARGVSLLTDIEIVWRTLAVVLSSNGAG